MSKTIPIEETSHRLIELVRSLGPGDEIMLTDGNEAIARIIPEAMPSPAQHPEAGSCEGMLIIDHEDDSYLEDFQDYM